MNDDHVATNGEVLEPDMLDSQPWPKHLVLEDFITSPEATRSVVKMVARSAFQKGEPIIMNRLSNPRDPSFLAANLSPGMRVVTVASDGIAGVAGFVYPGDRVDVLVTHPIPKEDVDEKDPIKEEKVTETLLTNIKVLAVNQRATGGGEGVEEADLPSSISLEVALEDAQRLRLGQETGYLSLALRGLGEEGREIPGITHVQDLSQSDVYDALGGRNDSVIIIRGVEMTEVAVAEPPKQENAPEEEMDEEHIQEEEKNKEQAQ
jgi:pilus assembly protein CpaB